MQNTKPSFITRAAAAFTIMVLAGLILPDLARAAASPDTLAGFLDKKYGKSGGPLGFLDKFLPTTGAQPTSFSVQGKRLDGSYWWSASFNGGNIRMFSEPRDALEKFCGRTGGTLSLVHRYVLLGGTEMRDVTLMDAETGRGCVVRPSSLLTWARQGAYTAPSFEAGRGGSGFIDYALPAIGKRDALGLFSCAAGGQPRWHVAILPTETGHMQTPAEHEGNLLRTSWLALSIRSVDAALVATTEAAAADAEAKSRASRLRSAQGEREQAERRSREAQALAPFRQSLAVGMRTNCGTILSLNGPLIEVQVPASSASGLVNPTLPAGASRIFVQRDQVFPERHPDMCDYR